MAKKNDLELQADALLAAAEAAEKEAAAKPSKKSKKAAAEAPVEAPRVMTDEEAKKAGIIRLDDKQVAAIPAASWIIYSE